MSDLSDAAFLWSARLPRGCVTLVAPEVMHVTSRLRAGVGGHRWTAVAAASAHSLGGTCPTSRVHRQEEQQPCHLTKTKGNCSLVCPPYIQHPFAPFHIIPVQSWSQGIHAIRKLSCCRKHRLRCHEMSTCFPHASVQW